MRITVVSTKTIQELRERVVAFRDARNWEQFHSLKNLIVSLNIEAAELLELTQWKDDSALEQEQNDPAFVRRVEEEAADVLLYLMLVANRVGFDLVDAAHRKIDHNEEKYPVHKAYGSAKKYNQL